MGHSRSREVPRNDADVLSQCQRRSAGVRHNQLQHIRGNEGLGAGAASVCEMQIKWGMWASRLIHLSKLQERGGANDFDGGRE